ncbi:hypothetical protein RhiirA4_250737 [Rhizophagus irregularis]|uniref:Uncharacterized protein n=1 Tax=Rhizophagus irregularis TaxID=588596 RepID=A0A2I1GSW1_9GLOM|nr:hypothetical protein RhiirA4_250737 [Rhizophagus irregularis]
MTNYSQINPSEIFTLEIPGVKIIVIPTFPSMASSSQTNHSEYLLLIFPVPKNTRLNNISNL